MFSSSRLSKSVTTTRQIEVYLLQNETNKNRHKGAYPFMVVFDKKKPPR